MEFWQRINTWAHRRPFTLDLLVALLGALIIGGIYAATLLPSLTYHDPLWDERAAAGLLSVPMVLCLAWRRAHPRSAMWCLAALCVLSLPIVELVFGIIAVPFIVHAAAAYGRRSDGRWALILGCVGGLLFAGRVLTSTPVFPGLKELFLMGTLAAAVWFIVLFAWSLGALTRARRLRVQAIEDRARRLEMESRQERALAAADERAHIAREMHDIVAHSLSVIIAQADGGRYAAVTDPELGRQALDTIAQTGRSSLAEMRRLLGVLRQEEDTEYRPQPGLDDVPELVRDLRASGLNIILRQEGTPRHQLAAGAELTAYRLLQEALTNCLKHAGPTAAVDALLSWTPKGLQIRVHDDGRGAAADPPAAGGGNGLRGMAERVALYDGTVTAGPLSGGGFAVDAHIPYSEA